MHFRRLLIGLFLLLSMFILGGSVALFLWIAFDNLIAGYLLFFTLSYVVGLVAEGAYKYVSKDI